MRRPWITACVLAWASLACAGAAGAQPAFDRLAPAKALAVFPERSNAVRGLAYGQPHELAASVLARQRCEAKAGAGEHCEVIRLNDQHITTGAEIRARVPERPHPLFLWHFGHEDVEIYLAGSIHILKPSLYPLPRQLTEAFERSDYLVLEVDISSIAPQELQRRTMAYAELPAQQTLRDVLPAPLHQRLERHLAAFGMTPSMLSRAKPALAMNQIVVSRLLTLGYLPDSGLESHFLARRAGRRVLALETLEGQLELLFEQPMDTQVQLLAETLDVEDHIEPMLADMLVAWLAGDDDQFLTLFKAQSGDSPLSQAFTRQLLDERHATMAEGIEGYLTGASGDRPATYFVLVGAAHLVGEQGIVQRLARAGMRGERIMSNHSISRLMEELP